MKPAGIPIKYRPLFDTEVYFLGQQLWHQLNHAQRGDFDAGKEKAGHEEYVERPFGQVLSFDSVARERCGHMSSLLARCGTAGLDEVRDARG